MDLFAALEHHDYGELHTFVDPRTGLRALVAIHSVARGPALGGCRALRYASSDAAVTDALRLARGMSYKAAISGLPHGGGKAVIALPPGEHDRAALFAAFGDAVESLGGRYLTCEDSGTSPADMDVIARRTRHVLGTSGGAGDPSPLTALGVRRGIEAAVKFRLQRSTLEGLHVAVQGVGHVGAHLVRELVGQGARVTIADIDARAVEALAAELGVEVVAPDRILALECDVLAPCALGGILNDATIPALRTHIVAPAANNVLLEPRHGDELHARGILYAPDYAINAGGLIKVAMEHMLAVYDEEAVRRRVSAIHDTLTVIFERAAAESVPTWRIADAIAEERIRGA